MNWTAKIELGISERAGEDISEFFVDAFMEGLIEAGAIDPEIYGSLTQGSITIELTVEADTLEEARMIGDRLFTAAQPVIPGREKVSLIGESTRLVMAQAV